MLGMAPKVAEGPGESRGMNGGLLQGLEVLLKGVVCVNRTTDSKSSCLVWSTRSLTTVFDSLMARQWWWWIESEN